MSSAPKTSCDFYPAASSIDPSQLSTAARELWEMENKVPALVKRDASLRAKIIDSCGMTCTFCHNEGTPVAASSPSHWGNASRVSIFADTNMVDFMPGRMQPDNKFTDTLLQLKHALGIEEVHLTGGEPTLHSDLPKIISIIKDLNMKPKMTSNGENPRVLEKCAEAGLESVVFSIFGTNADELAMVQHHKFRSSILAQKKIDALHSSIGICSDAGIAANANIVMPSFAHHDRIVAILDKHPNLKIRLLNSLEEGDSSYVAIYETLANLGAVPTAYLLTAGSSNTRVNYELPTGREIAFKQIRHARFDKACTDCPIDKIGNCSESYYGLRLYIDHIGNYLVGQCIQRMDLVEPVNNFLQGGTPKALNTFKEREYAQMTEFAQQRTEAPTDRNDVIRQLIDSGLTPVLPFEVPILVSQLDEKVRKQNELAVELAEVNHQSSETWHDNHAANEIERYSKVLQKMGLRAVNTLSSSVEISYPAQESLDITLGSVITLRYPGSEPETFLLTGSVGRLPLDHKFNLPDDTQIVTLGSPLGASLLGSKPGETVLYKVRGREIQVEVISATQLVL